VYFGEISLTGAVRAVPQTPARLKEAVKLGFTRAVLPEGGRGEMVDGVAPSTVAGLDRLVAEIAARSPRALRAASGRDDA
jgi:DNA repair protein RadA/Sms